ncbi:MAG: hypothetical protein PHR44_05500 [Candidatus Omnitrophica bacterium]|nr:hypothetical protein [Candidatus Omnitrophota bacterium]
MSYEQLIKNWHAKASEEDYFSKFVFEYLAFIAYLKTQKYLSNDSDRQAIQKLKQAKDIRKKYLERIKSRKFLRKDWEHIKQELDKLRLGNASRDLNSVEEIKWWNCSKNNLDEMSPEERQEIKGVIHSLSDWGNMVEFWCSIRNNLFHGTKDPERERDRFAVEYGYKTLKELMDIFLENNR